MLEYLNKPAINTLLLAQEEALRLEFDQVHPIHLLLGIIVEAYDIGGQVLSNLSLDLKTIRVAVEKVFGRGYLTVPLEKITYSPQTLRVLNQAVVIAKNRAHNIVGTEQMLRALLQSDLPEMNQLLKQLGLSIARVEQELKAVKANPALHKPRSHDLPRQYSPNFLTETAKKVIELARSISKQHGHSTMATEQLILAILKTPCLATKILNYAGLDEQVFLIELSRMIGLGSGCIDELMDDSYLVDRGLEYAWIIARKFSYNQIGSAHLLFGILQVDDSTSNHLLLELGLDPEQIRLDIIYLLQKYPDSPEPVIEDVSFELDHEVFDEISQDEEEAGIIQELIDYASKKEEGEN